MMKLLLFLIYLEYYMCYKLYYIVCTILHVYSVKAKYGETII